MVGFVPIKNKTWSILYFCSALMGAPQLMPRKFLHGHDAHSMLNSSKAWQILSDTGSWEICYWSTTSWIPALDADLGSFPPTAQNLLQVPLKKPLLLISFRARGQGQALCAGCADSVSPVLDYKNIKVWLGLSVFISSSLSPGHSGELLDTTEGPAKIVPLAEGNYSTHLNKAVSAKQQKLFYRIKQFYGEMTEPVKCQHSLLYCHYLCRHNRDKKSNPEQSHN